MRKTGYLHKKGHVRKNWKRRFFVLDGVWLSYHTREGGPQKGSVDLSSDGVLIRGALQIRAADISRFQFEVVQDNSSLVIAAENQTQMNDWIEALNSAVWAAQMGDPGQAAAAPAAESAAPAPAVQASAAVSSEEELVQARGAPPPASPTAAAPAPEPEGESLPLPDGWEEHEDGDGNKYYYNAQTTRSVDP